MVDFFGLCKSVLCVVRPILESLSLHFRDPRSSAQICGRFFLCSSPCLRASVVRFVPIRVNCAGRLKEMAIETKKHRLVLRGSFTAKQLSGVAAWRSKSIPEKVNCWKVPG